MKIRKLLSICLVMLGALLSCHSEEPNPGQNTEGTKDTPKANEELSGTGDSAKASSLAANSIIRMLGIKNVVEIAGELPLHCTKFPAEKYWILNASTSRQSNGCENVVLKTAKLFDYKRGELALPAGEDFALVLLGVDPWIRKNPADAPVMAELIDAAKVVIVEAPVEDYRRWYQADRIKKAAIAVDKKMQVDVRIANLYSKDTQSRHLTVLTKDGDFPRSDGCDVTKNAKRWEYLWNNANLNVRQGIAAEFLRSRDVKNINEVGGFCTPLCNYFAESKYTNIDPFVKSTNKGYHCTNAKLVQKGIEDVGYSKESNDPFAVVILGLYWEFIKDKDASKIPYIQESFKDASHVVLETPPNVNFSTRHMNQLLDYGKSLGFTPALGVRIHILGDQPNPYAFYRHLSILEKKK